MIWAIINIVTYFLFGFVMYRLGLVKGGTAEIRRQMVYWENAQRLVFLSYQENWSQAELSEAMEDLYLAIYK